MPGQTRTTVNGGTQEPTHSSGVGPWGWHGNNTNDKGHRGAEFGFAGLSGGSMGDEHGWHGRDDILTGGGFFGLGKDGQYGAGIGGKVGHGEIGYGKPGDGAYGSADVDAFGADAYGWVNPDKGAAAGASAYILQGSVTGGNIGSGNHDEEGRFGLGAGVGAAGRLHWADEDGDGLREYGFGADIGPVSFDYKTEDPARSLLNAGTFGLGGMAADLFGYEGNMTQDIGSAAGAAWDGIKSGASAVGDFASNAWDGVSNTASSIYDGASSALSSAASFLTSW